MTQLRVLKAVTVCAFLVLVITAWVYKFNASGYTQTLDSLQKSYGATAYLFIAVFSVVSLVSMPIFGIAGLVDLLLSRRLGRSALILGFLCCVLSFANLALWKKYDGIPSHSRAEGLREIYKTAEPSSPSKKPQGEAQNSKTNFHLLNHTNDSGYCTAGTASTWLLATTGAH